MSDLGFTLDKSNAPDDLNTPIPDGRYTLQVVKADIAETKDGEGKEVRLRIDVIGPSHSGRAVFANCLIAHRNTEEKKIADRLQMGKDQLSKLRIALGIDSLRDTNQLLNQKFEGLIGLSKPKEGYEPRNEIKRYYPLGSGGPGGGAGTGAPQVVKPTGGLPWEAQR